MQPHAAKSKLNITQVRTSLGLRTLEPHEIAEIRKSMGLSQQELAELLGIASGRTVRDWENDRPGRSISEPASIALILLTRELKRHSN